MNNTGCKLYGSLFENGIQIGIAFFAFITLVIKWQMEEDIYRRKWRIFVLDGAKQGVSGIIDHFINILIATKMTGLYKNTDQCAWYFISYFIATVLGTYIAYHLIQALTYYAKKYNIILLEESGNYGTSLKPNDILYTWFIQTFAWCFIILLSRAFVGFIIWIFDPFLILLSNAIASIFTNNPKFLFIVVMVICPGILNILQIWVQDHILKKTPVIEGLLDSQFNSYMEPINDEFL